MPTDYNIINILKTEFSFILIKKKQSSYLRHLKKYIGIPILCQRSVIFYNSPLYTTYFKAMIVLYHRLIYIIFRIIC